VQACLATSAATTFFESVRINGITYVDGGFGQNNPSDVTLSELEQSDWLAPLEDAVRDVGCFVSIGSGKPTYERNRQSPLAAFFMPKGMAAMRDAATICINIATGCNEQHLMVKKR
jgi:predicted acylesterase/phospholipase RssA